MKKPKKTGLVLGSGGARGWAHIGVLLELKKLGIKPDYIAGTSIGSIAGALYATNTVELAADMASDLDWKDLARLFLEINILRSGIVSGKNFINLLKDIIPARSFDELACPLAVVATDLEEESEIVFQHGDLFHAIRASMSIPGVFTPVAHNNRNLVDGGLKNPLPISVCRAMGADRVIAVDINLNAVEKETAPQKTPLPAGKDTGSSTALKNLKRSISKLLPQLQTPGSNSFERWFGPRKERSEPLSILDVLTRSFRMVENEITRSTLKLNPPDILIQPAVGDIMTLDFHRGPEAIEAGRASVQESRDELEALIKG